MNKMTKGAIATGVGVALLLGGGGTLAVWNTSENAKSGPITAGDLNLVAGAGTWTSETTGLPIGNINDYRIVPGETLKFAQNLEVTLLGDGMEASLELVTTNAAATSSFDSSNVEISPIRLTAASDPTKVLDAMNLTPTTLAVAIDGTANVVAAVEFKFDNISDFQGTPKEDNRADTGATYEFSNVGYNLQQKQPEGSGS